MVTLVTEIVMPHVMKVQVFGCRVTAASAAHCACALVRPLLTSSGL